MLRAHLFIRKMCVDYIFATRPPNTHHFNAVECGWWAFKCARGIQQVPRLAWPGLMSMKASEAKYGDELMENCEIIRKMSWNLKACGGMATHTLNAFEWCYKIFYYWECSRVGRLSLNQAAGVKNMKWNVLRPTRVTLHHVSDIYRHHLNWMWE